MAFDTETTGGVEEPNLDGIDMDDSEDVEDTGDGTAITLVVTVVAGTLLVAVLVVGANKFDIVGECFLLSLLLLLLLVTVVACAPLPGDAADGDDTMVCFEFGDDSDVLVHVVGNLLLFTVVEAFPFGIVAAVVLVC